MSKSIHLEFASFAERCQLWKPRLGLVLGSGLGDLVEHFDVLDEISYANVGGMAASTVPGHSGRFVRALIGHTETVIAQGRLHLYEGHSARVVTAHIRAMASLGTKTVLITNAAGAINRTLQLGLMAIADHLNLTGTSPLLGNPRFCDMGEAYTPALLERLTRAAREAQVPPPRGVYAGVIGPQYETPSEVRMLERLGADAVGMSTVLEVIQARALFMDVMGISCLTNWAAGISDTILDHEDVMARGQQTAGQLESLLRALVAA